MAAAVLALRTGSQVAEKAAATGLEVEAKALEASARVEAGVLGEAMDSGEWVAG